MTINPIAIFKVESDEVVDDLDWGKCSEKVTIIMRGGVFFRLVLPLLPEIRFLRTPFTSLVNV